MALAGKSSGSGSVSDDSSSILCRYFMHNACQKGNSCPFSHDRSTPPDLVCRFYLKGQCAYGDQCRYDHVRDRQQSSTKSSKPSVRSPQKFKTSPFPSKLEPYTPRGPAESSRVLSEVTSKPVPLGKKEEQKEKGGLSPALVNKTAEEWVKAKEFVPGQFYSGAVPPTYASAVNPGGGETENGGRFSESFQAKHMPWENGAAAAAAFPQIGAHTDADLLCPYMLAKGECPFKGNCPYLHGEVCDMCSLAVLHPSDKSQREDHMKECMKALEEDMQHSFAIANSMDKQCGICMDTVVEKDRPDNRFGILENCNHCYCLPCIRQWRCAKQFEKVIVRACPQCRVQSNFVTPSQYWVDTAEEKAKLIEDYKKSLADKPCRHFDQGRGECPFNDSCFYKHALPDGTIAPPAPRRRRRRVNADNEQETMTRISLWDFLVEAETRRELQSELEELMNYLTLAQLLRDEDDDDPYDIGYGYSSTDDSDY